MRTAEIVERLRARKGEFEAHGVIGLAIFGSRARGDNRDDSDLDLLLDVEPNRKFSLIDLVAIERRVGEDLGMTVGAVMRRALTPKFAHRNRRRCSGCNFDAGDARIGHHAGVSESHISTTSSVTIRAAITPASAVTLRGRDKVPHDAAPRREDHQRHDGEGQRRAERH